jgi:hypothetical protein
MNAQTAASTTSSAPLGARLNAFFARAEETFTSAGELEVLERLRAERRSPQVTSPYVVVAGEVKSGKSSLINALVGRPGLSPVDEDIATGTRIVLLGDQRDHASVHLIGEGRFRPIAIEEIAEWASAACNPANEKGVQQLAVGLAGVPLLERMSLIDTPGVGGLEAAHGSATLESLRYAHALLFVSDASRAYTAAELAFLRSAAARIDTVVFALTKIDLEEAWERVAADNGALLQENAPRFATSPVVAVSSRLLDEARAAEDSLAAELLEESGIPQLERVLLAMVADRASLLALSNAVRFAVSNLEAIEHRLYERASAATGDPRVGDALAAERQRLQELGQEKAEWQATLENELARINLDRADAIARGIRDLRLAYDDRSATASAADLEALPGELMDDAVALADRLGAETTARVEELARHLLGEIEADSTLALTLERITHSAIERDAALADPVRRSMGQVDMLNTVASFSTGTALARIAATAPLLGIIGGVPVLAIFGVGGLFAWKIGKGRHLLQLQADFRNWMREQLGEVQGRLTNEYSRCLIDLRPELRKAIIAYLAAREREINAAITENNAAHDRAEAERKQDQAAIEGERERVRSVLSEGEGALAELRTLRG